MKKDDIKIVGRVVLNQVMTSRLIRVVNSDPRVDKLEVTRDVTIDKVRSVSGWDGDAEKAASLILAEAPDLKQEAETIFQAAKDNRIAYLERGAKSPNHADF